MAVRAVGARGLSFFFGLFFVFFPCDGGRLGVESLKESFRMPGSGSRTTALAPAECERSYDALNGARECHCFGLWVMALASAAVL
jgi:hypothetical protein